MQYAVRIRRLAPASLPRKGGTKPVCANVDLFGGLIYNMLGISGISTPRCSPLPVCPAGAHRVERWYSPTASFARLKYLGVRQKYKPIEER
ncbi:MAG: hypothetical protein ACLS5S_03900 [Faecalibacterium sp.]